MPVAALPSAITPVTETTGGGTTIPPTGGGSTTGGTAASAFSLHDISFWNELADPQDAPVFTAFRSGVWREWFSVIADTGASVPLEVAVQDGSVQAGRPFRCAWWADLALVCGQSAGDWIATVPSGDELSQLLRRVVRSALTLSQGRLIDFGNGDASEPWYLRDQFRARLMGSAADFDASVYAAMFERPATYAITRTAYSIYYPFTYWRLKPAYCPRQVFEVVYDPAADPMSYEVWLCDASGAHLGTPGAGSLGSELTGYELIDRMTWDPLNVTVHGGGGTTDALWLRINGSPNVATARVGEVLSVVLDCVDQQTPPHNGSLRHGDGDSTDWTTQTGVWSGTISYDSPGTFLAQAQELLRYAGAPPIMLSNTVQVVIADAPIDPGDPLVRVNGQTGTVTVEVGAATAIEVVPGDAAAGSGDVVYGDDGTDAWTSASGETWTGSHVWAVEGVYSVTVTEDPDLTGNTVTVVVVAAPGAEDDPPEVTWLKPLSADTVRGQVSLIALATDDRAVTRVEFRVDNALVATANASSGGTDQWRAAWGTRETANGQYTLTATAYDTSGQSAEASITVSVANQLADDTRIFYSGPRLDDETAIRSILCVADIAPPHLPENSFRVDMTAGIPGTDVPTIDNLGAKYRVVPLGRRIVANGNPAPLSGGAVGDQTLLRDQTTAAMAAYLTPMLSVLEHRTAGTVVTAMCALRGYQGAVDPPSGMTAGTWLRAISDGTTFALTKGPNLLYRLSASGAFELVYDFGAAMRAWALAAGQRPAGWTGDYSYLGGGYGYVTGGAPAFACLQDPDDWEAVDMATFGTKLLIALNAVDGSRGVLLVLEAGGLPASAAEIADGFYVQAEHMPYAVELMPFGVLSINCVETERATAGVSTSRAGSGSTVDAAATGDSALDGAATGSYDAGETLAWLGCSVVNGGALLKWDGSRLELVTSEIEEITALYADERTGDAADAYETTLWIGTRGGRVYRHDWEAGTVSLELNSSEVAITTIRRFRIPQTELNSSTYDDDQSFGDGLLYAGTEPSGIVFRRGHVTDPELAWSEAHDYSDPAYLVASGLWKGRLFRGSMFLGGPGQLLQRWNGGVWSRARQFDAGDVARVSSFVKNAYRRLFVGTGDGGRIYEMALADADVATTGVRGMAMIALERGAP